MPNGNDGDEDGLSTFARFTDAKLSGAASKLSSSLAGTVSKGKEKLSEKRRERKRQKQRTQAQRDRAIREARKEARMEAEKEFRKEQREQFKEQERKRLERADQGILGTIAMGFGMTGEESEGDDDSFLGFAPPDEPFFSGEGMGMGGDEPFLTEGGW